MSQATVEGDVVRALEAGDPSLAVTSALRSYGPELVSYLRSVLGDPDGAVETYAQVCENAWKGISLYRREGSFRGWLYGIAYRAAQDYRRDGFRRRVRRLETGEISALVAQARSSLRPDRQHERAAQMEDVLAQLGAEERSMVLLRVARGMSWKEVARVLGDDEAAVRKRFQRLRNRVRDLLQG